MDLGDRQEDSVWSKTTQGIWKITKNQCGCRRHKGSGISQRRFTLSIKTTQSIWTTAKKIQCGSKRRKGSGRSPRIYSVWIKTTQRVQWINEIVKRSKRLSRDHVDFQWIVNIHNESGRFTSDQKYTQVTKKDFKWFRWHSRDEIKFPEIKNVHKRAGLPTSHQEDSSD